MNIVKVGTRLQIYKDDLETFKELPAGTYEVQFHPMMGFYLEEADELEPAEEKVYGSHPERIQKVLTSYQKFDRSLGIILSGNKGMGKSMFVQMLADAAINLYNTPVILVKEAYVGIASFLDSIRQDVLVVFDEFEKMFPSDRNNSFGQQQQPPANLESQNKLLGLFDGMSSQKRLYALTVNDLGKVNEFMLNRPGRFHYHIRFDYPLPEEIEIYLGDQVEPAYHHEIKEVISFSKRVKLNYDSLRAIAFELNEGRSFKSAIGDLNILTTETPRYNIKAVFNDGRVVQLRGERMDLFSDMVYLSTWNQGINYQFEFNPIHAKEELLFMTVPGSQVELTMQTEDEEDIDGLILSHLEIRKQEDERVNYRLTV